MITKLTSKFQTTIPASVRKAMGLKKGDHLLQRVLPSGALFITKIDAEEYGWLKLAQDSFAKEWLSPEDEEAFRDLQ